MQLDRSGTESPSLDTNTTLSSSAGGSKLHSEGSVRSHSSNEEPVDGKLGKDAELQEQETNQPTKAAKIHDFCFGIPFGEFCLCILPNFKHFMMM